VAVLEQTRGEMGAGKTTDAGDEVAHRP